MKIDTIEQKLSEIKPGLIGKHKEFSVLITIVNRRSGPALLYQVRGNNILRQPGEISFPGGAKEKDETDYECALRETSEELGIRKNEITSVVKIADEYVWNGSIIHVYAGIIDEKTVDSMKPSKEEVAELFEVPIEWFLDKTPERYEAGAVPSFVSDIDESLLGFKDGYPWQRLRIDVPVYFYGKYCIWGLTGRITSYFIDRLKNGE